MHRMTPKWTWTLNSQKYSLYSKYLGTPEAQIWSVSLYDMYKVGDNWKCIKWPKTEREDLTFNITLYTLNTYHWGPNVCPYRSTISRFRDTTYARTPKIGNAPNEHLTVKSTNFTTIKNLEYNAQSSKDTQDFDISKWAIERIVTRETLGTLREEEFTTKDALCLLSESDIHSLPLSLGQSPESCHPGSKGIGRPGCHKYLPLRYKFSSVSPYD